MPHITTNPNINVGVVAFEFCTYMNYATCQPSAPFLYLSDYDKSLVNNVL